MEGDTYALILHRERIQAIPLPDFTLGVVTEHIGRLPSAVKDWIDAYNAHVAAAQALRDAQETKGDVDRAAARLEAAQSGWRAALEAIAADASPLATAGWLPAYFCAFHVVPDEGHPAAERAALEAWKACVARTVAFLAGAVWDEVAPALPPGVRQVLLTPTGPTALLPLHAAAPHDITVAHAPSLAVWQQCRERAAGRGPDSLFLAAPATDLPFTGAESEWLQERFRGLGRPARVLSRSAATGAAFQAQARGHGLVHYSGHADYNWADPLESALACAGDPLTLAEMRRSLELGAARLVTLSACSTGVSDVFASGEEFLGLPTALIEVGAPAVVASLWPVHDMSTAFLMDRFYALWLGGEGELSIAAALQAAAGWLRGATKADLLARVAAGGLSPQAQALVQDLMEQVMETETARMADTVALPAAEEVDRRPEEHPFASPYYWAAFAAYGAVLG